MLQLEVFLLGDTVRPKRADHDEDMYTSDEVRRSCVIQLIICALVALNPLRLIIHLRSLRWMTRSQGRLRRGELIRL